MSVVRFVMDQRDLAQGDLVPMLGSKAAVSSFLGGRRPLSKAQAVRLHQAYKIPLDLLFDFEEANAA